MLKRIYVIILLTFIGCESDSSNPNLLLATTALTYPQITSLEPRSVNPPFSNNGVNYSGSTVIIRGRNFSANIPENTVAFNGIPGVVTAATTTELTANVPIGVSSGVITVSKSSGVCDSVDRKSGINCGGADIFVSCYGAYKEEFGSQVLLESNKTNSITFTKSPIGTKAFRVDLASGLRTFTLNCPTSMDVTSFSKKCEPSNNLGIQPGSTPQITLDGGYTLEFLVSTQPGDCTFSIF